MSEALTTRRIRTTRIGGGVGCLALLLVACGADVSEDQESAASAIGASCGASQVLAFPGAEGFGRFASGGRGGRVVFVTNTNDSGPGSLREALEVVSGPRIVVFKVGGVLRAKKQIEVRGGNVTVAGQTAPGNGFVLTGARIRVASDNVIIRGLKVRPGDGPGDLGRNRDAISVGTSKQPVSNVVVDHNSLTWAIDETLSAWYTAKNITFSYNLIAEPLHDSIHVDEGATTTAPHSMGMLIGDDIDRISVLRNMFSSCSGRNPLARGTAMELVNNYIYNFGTQGTDVAGEAPTSIHILSNYFREGPNSSGTRYPINLGSSKSGFRYHVNGNLSARRRPSLSGGEGDMISGPGEAVMSSGAVFASSDASVMPASDVLSHLTSTVGARWPVLDAVDARIIDQTKNGTGRRIDRSSQVGGLPSYPTGTAPKDSDGDGIPDSVESILGTNPLQKDDAGDVDGDGYTNIEEYINGLVTGFDARGCAGEPESPASASTRVEAESMKLTGFSVVSSEVASGGKWIQTKPGEAGSARFTFSGAKGAYDVRVGYFDENDGASSMSLKVNGAVVQSWTWNASLGSANASSQTRAERRIANVQLSTGDVVELSGKSDGAEPLRTDFVELAAR